MDHTASLHQEKEVRWPGVEEEELVKAKVKAEVKGKQLHRSVVSTRTNAETSTAA